jgi:hypothetical protein
LKDHEPVEGVVDRLKKKCGTFGKPSVRVDDAGGDKDGLAYDACRPQVSVEAQAKGPFEGKGRFGGLRFGFEDEQFRRVETRVRCVAIASKKRGDEACDE